MQKLLRRPLGWQELRPALLLMAESGIPLRESIDMFAHAYVNAALEITRGNQVHAGKLIGAHRNTISRWSRR